MSVELRIEADDELVRRLLRSQAPQLAEMPLKRLATAGVNNTIYRLGDDLTVRLPQTAWCADHIRKEQRWLPALGEHVTLRIPTLVHACEPGGDFPWHWSIYGWLDGDEAVHTPVTDEHAMARQLATLIEELQQVTITDGPLSGEHSGMRGLPLAVRDPVVRQALANITSFDTAAATAAWEAAVRTPAWQGPPVWSHGDLHPGNVLVDNGVLSAVIDWEMLSVGDPALDLSGAWMLLTEAGRETFRNSLTIDDDTWARGRGWALCIGVIAAAYYHDSNPILAGFSRRAAQDAVDDFLRNG
ncbi:aminoglycoside phosphotransferase family protein [Micromonospora sp. NPDC002717]|uniref:aminoglycoside phosphotransferase family protein n=1 Tax=Micromonospora sp. NPDC002717 TaxID=3154424 RepID=UPI003331B3D9